MNAGKLRDIIKHCWSSGPEYRPTFKELLSTLEHNVSIILSHYFWTIFRQSAVNLLLVAVHAF